MERIAMVLRRPPYGDISAAEAVRHALGGASGDYKVSLILTDGGVLLARKGQYEAGTGFTSLEAALKDCVDMDAEVVVDEGSLAERHVRKEDLIEGIRVADVGEIGQLLKQADATMIF